VNEGLADESGGSGHHGDRTAHRATPLDRSTRASNRVPGAGPLGYGAGGGRVTFP
jgi:hypothetical protein